MDQQTGYLDFKKALARGNIVPVTSELDGIEQDPVTAYRRLRGEVPSFLMEEADEGGKILRSVIGTHPWLVLYFFPGRMEARYEDSGRVSSPCTDPAKGLRDILSKYRSCELVEPAGLQPGLTGYLDYETIRHWERIQGLEQVDPRGPEAGFMAPRRVVVMDHQTKKTFISSMVRQERHGSIQGAYESAMAELEDIRAVLTKSPGMEFETRGFRTDRLECDFSKEQFEQAVIKAKNYIMKGDAIQIVLSRKLMGRAIGDSLSLYESLRLLNPSPYMLHMSFGGKELVGASPEMLVRLRGRRVFYRPIAGTRPRGLSRAEDFRLAEELLQDPKERAEHVMLVDLGRNDVGRVAVPGSVRVSRFMQVERFSHVMHIVSGIEADLEHGKDALDLLVSVFPAGTVSGAPKIRAMEIIAELEPGPRGAYAGAVGTLGFNGDLDTCIPIRTAFIDGSRLTLQAGAGIVMDSVPEREYQETAHKAEALVRAIERSAAA